MKPAECARVVIVGATSAVAGEVAAIYAARGARLFLIGRNEGKLSALQTTLGSAVVGSMVADLDHTDGNADRVAQAIEALGGVDIALLCHGLLGDQIETERHWPAAEQIFCTNLLSMISLLIPLANALELRGGGHLAVLSSVAGERGRPRNYTYGAAKAALSIYTQGIRSRLWSAGVGVHIFKLGPIDTPMTQGHKKNALFSTAPVVAQQIVQRMDRGSGIAFVPGFWRPIMALVRNMPERVFQRIGALSGR